MSIDLNVLSRVIDAAHEDGTPTLAGPRAMAVARALGVRCPLSLVVQNPAAAARADTTGFGDRVVVKAVSPRIVHKTDVGAVAIVRNQRDLVSAAVDDMARRLQHYGLTGFMLDEYISYDQALGGELLVGVRWTDDFGPIVTIGPGGVYAEFVAATLRPDRNVVSFSPSMPAHKPMGDLLREAALVQLATDTFRGQSPRLALARLEELVTAVMMMARNVMPIGLAEFEINPLVVSGGELVALDARATLGHEVSVPVPRPVAKLRYLLTPQSIAIVGVSGHENPGRIILHNVLREGFDKARVFVVKPGVDRIEGCMCVPSLADLPQRVDLLVLSVAAPQAAALAVEAIQTNRAESLIVIPGGFEEKTSGAGLAAGVRQALDAARQSASHGPVVNGGNCVGIRSKPGRYDTTFIPDEGRTEVSDPVAPIAMIAQSGAFVLSTQAKLPRINPKYCITVGNQIDLTVGDYLKYLRNDLDLELFAVYVEGFKPLDGAAFMETASELVARGQTVILYRGGRTAAGTRATSTHTASMAGDYDVTRALARQAGVILTETLSDFEDLIKLFALLRTRRVDGWRLGAVSNAGFECVALADNLGAFQLPAFSDGTVRRLRTVFQLARVDALVDVQNPLDLTPMIGDTAYDEAVRAVLTDQRVDVGVIGCVPMTPALSALPLTPASGDAVFDPGSIVTRLTRINSEVEKAWISVVDAGDLYDPMVARLEASGVPTFRTADRALRLFEIFCAARLRQASAAGRECATDAFGVPDSLGGV